MKLFWIAGLGLLLSASAYFLGPRRVSDDIQHAVNVALDSRSNPLVIIGISWLGAMLAPGLAPEIPCVRHCWNSMVSPILDWVTGYPLRIANSLEYNTRRRIRTYVAGSIVLLIGLFYLCNVGLWYFNRNWVLWNLIRICYCLGASSEVIFSLVTTEWIDESASNARIFFSRFHFPSVILFLLRRDRWNSFALAFIIPTFISLSLQFLLLNTQFDPRELVQNGDAPRIRENAQELLARALEEAPAGALEEAPAGALEEVPAGALEEVPAGALEEVPAGAPVE